jgi:hypothetical protein
MVAQTKSQKYAALLKKLDEVKSDSGYWRPEMGKNTIRILPAKGAMSFFFIESGMHYMGENQSYACADINSKGKQQCPLCNVNKILWEAGEAAEAKKWYVRRSYLMNIIVRGKESDGPKIYACGQSVFQQLATIIADPDVGDVTDPEEGFDLKLERTGEKIETKYTLREARDPSLLGSDEEIEAWMGAAIDLEEYISQRIPDYVETAKQSGAAILLDITEEAEDGEEESKPVVEDEEEHAVPTKASEVISQKMGSGRMLRLRK